MWQRIDVLLSLAALVALAILLVRVWNGRRVQRLIEGSGTSLWDSLGETLDGRRTVIMFSTRSCAACRTAQAPAVSAVEEQLGPAEVRVIRVDAARRPGVMRAFGVLTVPSTIVVARGGQVVAVNHGFAPRHRLLEQLQRT